MKRIVILISFIYIAVYSQSQIITTAPLDEFYKQYKMHEYIQNFGSKSEIEGSPYASEEYLPGEVITTGNLAYKGIPLRLNIYSNEMEFKTEDGSIFSLGTPEIIDFILIGKEKYIYCPYSQGPRIQKGYFRILTEGKVILLEKKIVKLLPAEPAQAYKDAEPAKFVKSPAEYYIRILPAEAKRIADKKDFQEIVTDHPVEMNDFIRKNKIRFTKSEDMVKLIEYYNSLVE